MSRHYLFLCHPDHGHVIPTLAVVAELVRRGNRVTYLTADSMTDIVTEAGAEARTYKSRYRSADFDGVAFDAHYLLSLLIDESEAMVQAAIGDADAGEFDAVVYDTSILFAGRVLGRRWGIPAIQQIPMFASNPSFSYLRAIYGSAGSGPSEQAEPPEPPPWIGAILARITDLTSGYGLDVAPHELWWEIPELSIVTIPRSFQYAGETFDERFAFVGPSVADRAFLGSWEPPRDGAPVVLVSLGAVFNEHPRLLRTCLDAFRDQPWHVVMTVADGVDPADLGPPPPNVEIHRWVPHHIVLEHAVIAVTHGGMGTVMEALRAGTPMVVMPTAAIDRPTGQRIEELKLGAWLDADELTAQRLVESVRAVLADEQITANVAHMRRDIDEAGGAVRAADVIEQHLTRER